MAREREVETLPPAEAGPLDKRVLDVMSGFPGAMTFQGLRRTLGAHPESLSRVLRRLQREGSLKRTSDGYRLAGTALSDPVESSGISRFPRKGDSPIVELRLSSEGDTLQVLGHLAGRWFGEFRWVGSYEEGDRTTLLWTSGTEKELLAMVLDGTHMSIYHNSPQNPPGNESLQAYELLQHVMVGLRTPRGEIRAPGVLTFELGEGPITPKTLAG